VGGDRKQHTGACITLPLAVPTPAASRSLLPAPLHALTPHKCLGVPHVSGTRELVVPAMDNKRQGFFSALREEVARGLSPARARRRSEAAAALRGCGEALAPLMEGPDPDGGVRARREGWGRWVRGQLHLARAPPDGGAARRNDLRLLLGVLGAPLAPVHVCAAEPLPHLSVKDTPIVRAPLLHPLLLLLLDILLCCGHA
jgi:hypothetical protein